MNKKRARIEDVVRLTGLSRATIDRVLNNRPGVRAQTKDRVEEALAELGFAPDAMYYRKVVPPANIWVLIPRGTNPFFQEIERGIVASVENTGAKNVRVQFVGFDPYRPKTIVKAIMDVPEDTSTIITVGVDSREAREAIDYQVAKGIRVVTIVSDVPLSKRAVYVGQDNFVAGKTAGRLMSEIVPQGDGEIAAVLGHLEFRHLLDRRSGFQQTLGLHRPDLTVFSCKPYGTDERFATEIVAELGERSGLKGIYLCGGGQPHLIEAFSSLWDSCPTVIGHEITAASRAALETGTYNVIIAHDVLELGRKAIEAAVDNSHVGIVACGINIYVNENLPEG